MGIEVVPNRFETESVSRVCGPVSVVCHVFVTRFQSHRRIRGILGFHQDTNRPDGGSPGAKKGVLNLLRRGRTWRSALAVEESMRAGAEAASGFKGS